MSLKVIAHTLALTLGSHDIPSRLAQQLSI